MAISHIRGLGNAYNVQRPRMLSRDRITMKYRSCCAHSGKDLVHPLKSHLFQTQYYRGKQRERDGDAISSITKRSWKTLSWTRFALPGKRGGSRGMLSGFIRGKYPVWVESVANSDQYLGKHSLCCHRHLRCLQR